MDKKTINEYQKLINTGMAWQLEGSVGRFAMYLINNGYCCLGTKGHRDFYGNYVPSRYEVKTGTKGSLLFVLNKRHERGEK